MGGQGQITLWKETIQNTKLGASPKEKVYNEDFLHSFPLKQEKGWVRPLRPYNHFDSDIHIWTKNKNLGYAENTSRWCFLSSEACIIQVHHLTPTFQNTETTACWCTTLQHVQSTKTRLSSLYPFSAARIYLRDSQLFCFYFKGLWWWFQGYKSKGLEWFFVQCTFSIVKV